MKTPTKFVIQPVAANTTDDNDYERKGSINDHILDNDINDDPPIISLNFTKTPTKFVSAMGKQPVATNATDVNTVPYLTKIQIRKL